MFSSTPLPKTWANSVQVGTSAAEYVADLKQQSGGDIGIHGSIQLATSLFKARLVDELRLVVAPAVAGHGRRLFGDDELQKLETVDVDRSPSGALLLHYRANR